MCPLFLLACAAPASASSARWLRRTALQSVALTLAVACVPRDPPAQRKAAPASSSISAAKPAAPAEPSVEPAANSAGGVPDPALAGSFSDPFERVALGPDWRSTSSVWAVVDGRLCGQNARNHPVWLARRLPTNASIEFQASTDSPDGDIKAEFWGDGRSAASGQSYTDATSYLTIFGGWQNTFHVLARIDEHAANRREIKLIPGGADFTRSTVVPQRVYQFRVERRDGHTVHWSVDGVELLTYPDPQPLAGMGHEHFGFNDWQVRVCFDNLRVTPLQD